MKNIIGQKINGNFINIEIISKTVKQYKNKKNDYYEIEITTRIPNIETKLNNFFGYGTIKELKKISSFTTYIEICYNKDNITDKLRDFIKKTEDITNIINSLLEATFFVTDVFLNNINLRIDDLKKEQNIKK